MSVWKLQCHFCGDTVSTGKLNRSYYKLHLEVMHNMQQHGDRLLDWTLSQQSVEGNVGMNGLGIQRSLDGVPSTPVPGPLLNMKGITVQRVDESGEASAQSQKEKARAGAAKAEQLNAVQMRHQEQQAINTWANGCEHGCRICKKNGKYFKSFTKPGLLKHLQTEHEVSERDYKDEFKCLNLVTRASYTMCKECGARLKRIPTSLSLHLKKHGLNIRTYWLKHLKLPNISVLDGTGTGGIHLARGVRGGITKRGMSRTGIYKCTVPNCTKSFDNMRALKLHISWHGRGDVPRGRGHPLQDTAVVNDRVDGENQLGGDGEEMVMEMDPMDILELGIGDADEERGDYVEVDLENLEVVNDDGATTFGDVLTVAPIEITPLQEEGESVNTPDMTDENDDDGLNSAELEAEVDPANEVEAQSDVEAGN